MYIYVQHALVTASGAKSQMKDFGKTEEANLVDERVEFSIKFKEKLANKSSYVVNLMDNLCIRNRYRYDRDNPVSDDEVMKYIVAVYQNDILSYLASLDRE